MMAVSQIQSLFGANQASATQQTKSSAGDFNTFLQLLVTELKNQDPNKPMDPTQTVTQLATFSSVEQAVKTNTLLASLNSNAGLSQAGSLIGHTVTSSDGSLTGVVKSIQVTDTGLVATLADGKQILIGSGVTIS
jgi:flagellar basal-body rod modification protein FlgD